MALDRQLQQWTKTISGGHEEISRAVDEKLEEMEEQLQACATTALEARMVELSKALEANRSATAKRLEEVTEMVNSFPKTSRILDFEERVAACGAALRKKADVESVDRILAELRGELRLVTDEVQSQGRRVLECQLLSREAGQGAGHASPRHASQSQLGEAASLAENCRVLKQYVEQCRESMGTKIAACQEQLASLVMRVSQIEAEFAMAEELDPIRSNVTELQTSMIDMVTCLETRVDRASFEQLEARVEGSLSSRGGSVAQGGAADTRLVDERIRAHADIGKLKEEVRSMAKQLRALGGAEPAPRRSSKTRRAPPDGRAA